MAKSVRKREEDLAKAKEDLEKTFSSVRDAIFLLDRESRIFRMNASAEKLFTDPPEVILWKHCWEVVQ